MSPASEPLCAQGRDDLASLYARAGLAARVALLINSGLALAKLLAGLYGHSLAMVADAVNSLGDAVTSAAVLFAIRVARRPADADHPYGHSRAESIAALSVSMLVGLSAVAVSIEAVRHLWTHHPVAPAWMLWVAAANALIKEGMYHYQRRAGLRAGSQALVAGAWDHRSDALGSAAVLIGLAIVRSGGPGLIWADEVAALVVCGVIFVASIQMYRLNASRLMDEQCDSTVLAQIEAAAVATPGVVAVEQVRARRSGIEVHVDLHIEVDGRTSVEVGHGIGHAVQRAVVTQVPAVSQVLVHIEPAAES